MANRIGRDARTGQYIPLKEAERRPNTTTTEPHGKTPKGGGGKKKG